MVYNKLWYAIFLQVESDKKNTAMGFKPIAILLDVILNLFQDPKERSPMC